jgi:hypothetical protein
LELRDRPRDDDELPELPLVAPRLRELEPDERPPDLDDERLEPERWREPDDDRLEPELELERPELRREDRPLPDEAPWRSGVAFSARGPLKMSSNFEYWRSLS